MKKEDIKRLHELIQAQIQFHASRLDFDTDKQYVHAAAVAMSCLQELRGASFVKPLKPEDMDVAIQAFLDGAEIEEVFSPMGWPIFKRKKKEQV